MGGLHKFFMPLLVAAISGMSASVFAQCIVTTPEQVVVDANGIFVNVEGEFQEVESISMANDGYVVAIPNPQLWYCKNCKSHVPYPKKTCHRCKNENPKDQGE
ncbi:MAG: hypothetical protein S4CHLAM123_11670 [Chlamydiales bacterium]|nr:hypothetical protein [Chlamydiales bacterium]